MLGSIRVFTLPAFPDGKWETAINFNQDCNRTSLEAVA